MAYTPLQVPSRASQLSTTSLMAKSGLNLRDLPQLLTPEQALVMRNYLLTTEGGLQKRKGLEELFDASVSTGILMLEEWTSDIILFAHGTTLAAYQISTDTITNIKTDFVNSQFSGTRYGDYFFVASSGDRLGRLSFTLDYDAQTANYTVGDILTGTTSGATAIILEDADAGVTGTLTLGNIQGTFVDGELITDVGGGSADVDGTLNFVFTSIAAAPIAQFVTAIDTRLFAVPTNEPEAIRYSEVDDGTNPPFDAWPEGTLATDGGTVRYKNAGSINVIDNLGKTIFAFADKGKWAFSIDTLDVGGTLTKTDTTQMYLEDEGGKAAIQTDDGIFYINSQGLWLLQNLPQQDVRFTDQSIKISNPLGNDFFEDVNFDQADMVKDDVTNTLIITFDNDSTENNSVLTYNTDLKAFGTITGWNLNRFLNIDGTLYGGGSNTAKVWQLFSRNDDDGVDIFTEFKQELSVGTLWTRKEILGQYIQGELSAGTVLKIRFDIFDRTGKEVTDKLVLQWNYLTAGAGSGGAGWGTSGWGTGGWGSGSGSSGTVENFNGFRGRIKNFQRIRLRITGNDKLQHTINWFSMQTKEKVDIRRRKLIQLTP